MSNFIPQYMINDIRKNNPSFLNGLSLNFLSEIFKWGESNVGSATQQSSVSDLKKGKNRTVFDAEEKYNLPGKEVRVEGSKKCPDEVANNAYDYCGIVYDFFKKRLKRNSFDDNGAELLTTVHYGERYPNAFYNGEQIVMGNGDGEIFLNFCLLDILGHEWGHGVVSTTANLEYYGQSGALNESYADIFGICAKQFSLNQSSKESNWKIGEGIFTDKINGSCIRNMQYPGTAYDDQKIGRDRQPSHIKDMYNGDEDRGGVHINSSIPSRIFCEYAINIGGYTYNEPLKIWYETLTTKLHRHSDFQDFVNKVQEVIISNYGIGKEYECFKEASKSVGLLPRHPIFNQLSI